MTTSYIHNEFDLLSIYRTVFGYRGLPFPAGDIQAGLTPDFIPDETIGAILSQFKKTANGRYILVPMSLGSIKTGETYALPVE